MDAAPTTSPGTTRSTPSFLAGQGPQASSSPEPMAAWAGPSVLSVAIARLEHAHGTQTHEIERVGHKRVEPVLGEMKLDNGSLCRGEVNSLGSPAARIAALKLDALFDDL